MDKMELYHYHTLGNHDEVWEVGREIIVTPSFKSYMNERFESFTTAINTGYSIENYHDFLNNVDINNLDKEAVIQLLAIAQHVSYYGNMFKREAALENYRSKKCSNLPSRLHCMYLTDELGVNAWKEKFPTDKLVLYRLEVEGLIFKTSEQFLPDEELSYLDAYNKSYDYWHPDFRRVRDDSNEYLVQGKVKILERIK